MNTKPVQEIPTAPFFARLFIVMGEAFLPKGDHYVSQEVIREKISEWENDTSLALYRMTSRYQQSPFAEMIYSFIGSGISQRRILPTVKDIESMVKSASDKYQSTIDDYFTQGDLNSLLSCLAGERGRLEADVTNRTVSFKESIRINDRNLQFVGEMRVLYGNVRIWRKLPIKHDFSLEESLVETLSHIFDDWERLCEEKDASKNELFFENIDAYRAHVYALYDQVIPKKKSGKRGDIESIIIGFEMHHLDDCIM